MLKKLLKFGLEYALKRYQSRSYRRHHGSYDRYYGYPGKRFYKKRKRKKLFDLFD